MCAELTAAALPYPYRVLGRIRHAATLAQGRPVYFYDFGVGRRIYAFRTFCTVARVDLSKLRFFSGQVNIFSCLFSDPV